jgi:excisionase family DNA binding protein
MATLAIPTIEEIRSVVREELRAAVRELTGSPLATAEFTTDQAAEMLGIHPKTLRAWAGEGRIIGTKHGRSWRFTAAQVEAARHPSAALAEDVLRRLG